MAGSEEVANSGAEAGHHSSNNEENTQRQRKKALTIVGGRLLILLDDCYVGSCYRRGRSASALLSSLGWW